MAVYTVQLKDIMYGLNEKYCDGGHYDTLEQCIENVREKIFDFDYPIFDKEYKPVLETKILRFYAMEEIGQETYGLWKHYLHVNMVNNMAYFNQLYESELLKFNPLENVNVTTDHSGTNNLNGKVGFSDTKKGHSNTTTDETGGTKNDTWDKNVRDGKEIDTTKYESGVRNEYNTTDTTTYGSKSSNSGKDHTETWNAHSDTPQTLLTDVKDMRFLSNADWNDVSVDNGLVVDKTGSDKLEKTGHDEQEHKGSDTLTKEYQQVTDEKRGSDKYTRLLKTVSDTTNEETDKSTTETNNTTTDSYLDKRIGKEGGQTYSSMLKEFRETFLNIDAMVIDSLQGLFMQIW